MPRKESRTPSKVVRVEAFESSDCQLFPIYSEAEKHQREINFREWYEDGNELATMEGEIPAKDLVSWVKENQTEILKFLLGERVPQ